MTILIRDTDARTDAVYPRVARTLWQWLVLGMLAVALWPAARGDTWLVGALPFWLVVAPASALLMLHRRRLAAAWRDLRRPGIRPEASTLRVAQRGPQARRFRSPRVPARPVAHGVALLRARRDPTERRALGEARSA